MIRKSRRKEIPSGGIFLIRAGIFARFEDFVDTVSVNGDGTYLEGKEIIFYRKGKDGCVITVKS